MPFACSQTNCAIRLSLRDDQVFISRGSKPKAPPLYQLGLLLYWLAHQTDVRQLSFLFQSVQVMSVSQFLAFTLFSYLTSQQPIAYVLPNPLGGCRLCFARYSSRDVCRCLSS